jgi:hypothetical protein
MPGQDETWRFEAEAEWPPLAQGGAWAEAVRTGDSCASNTTVLSVRGDGEVTMAMPVPKDGTWRVLPRVFRRGGKGEGTLELRDRTTGAVLASWTWKDESPLPSGECTELGGKEVLLSQATPPRLVVIVRGGEVSLDKTTAVLLGLGSGPKPAH